MSIIPTTQIRKGNILVINGQLFRVLSMTHKTPGNLRAIINVVMKNLATGTKMEERFRSADTVDKANLDVVNLQYLYAHADRYAFMNTENYEQLELDEETVGDAMQYITPDAVVQAVMYGEQIVGIELPAKVELKVVETTPYIKGATVANAPKPAKLETGLTVNIPAFIVEGEVIRIDTTTGEYVERAK
jgi:elongation factor P